MMGMRLNQQRIILLLTSAATMLVITSIGSHQHWVEEADKASQLGAAPGPPLLSRTTRAPVVRQSKKPPGEAMTIVPKSMVLSEFVLDVPKSMTFSEYVLEEIEPGLFRASAWSDDQFQPADLAMLRSIVAWLGSATGHCRRLHMMGAPVRSGNGLRPELAVCRDPAASAGTSRSPCLVYQLGFTGDWSLAEQMARNACHVFVLDHREEAEPEGEHSFHVQFRRLGVGRNEHAASGGRILTLDGLMRELGHQQDRLFFLRADLNGLETDMLLDQVVDHYPCSSQRCVLGRVDQLSLRLHLRRGVEHELPFYRDLERGLKQLYRRGFELVYSAPYEAGGRWKFPGQREPITLMHDVLLVRRLPPSRHFSTNRV